MSIPQATKARGGAKSYVMQLPRRANSARAGEGSC